MRTRAGLLHRAVWRWHFYGGVIVGPVLTVMAVTGALFVFEAEIQEWFDRQRYYPPFRTSRATLEEQLASAQVTAPSGYEVVSFQVSDDPRRATEVFLTRPGEFKRTLVDPYSARVLGESRCAWFFALVLRIHRSLLVGTFGRIVTELTTGWTIVLIVTGVYLWWPRRWSRLGGSWLPRLSAHRYVVWRDLHALTGVVAAPLAATIALTGLLYTSIWGSGYFWAATRPAGARAQRETPASRSAPEAPSLSADAVVSLARRYSPEGSIFVQLASDPRQAVVCSFWGKGRPAAMARLVLDRATGEVIHAQRTSELPALAWWSRWNYPTHVGSLWGWPTKVLWFGAAAALAAMPLTGLAMWWMRRPPGTLGTPRKVDVRIPRAAWALMIVLGLSMPLLGASLVLAALVERFVVGPAPHRRGSLPS